MGTGKAEWRINRESLEQGEEARTTVEFKRRRDPPGSDDVEEGYYLTVLPYLLYSNGFWSVTALFRRFSGQMGLREELGTPSPVRTVCRTR
jgi:hypothetical protein